MHNLPFDKPGRFFRGNLHTHSTTSDGLYTPEETCKRYREAGYDFICLSDHFQDQYNNFKISDTAPFRTDYFTTIIGAELHTGFRENGKLWHILAVGLPLDFAQYPEGETGGAVSQRALDAGAFVAAAHIRASNLTENDILSLGPIDALEVWNGIGFLQGRADGWQMADTLFQKGHYYNVCASDDAHFVPGEIDFMTGWVHVKSAALTPDALLAALKAGHYYSSTGPQIFDVQVLAKDHIKIRCSPVTRIVVLGGRPNWQMGYRITEADIKLERYTAPFARVMVRDEFGREAWTNPFMLPE